MKDLFSDVGQMLQTDNMEILQRTGPLHLLVNGKLSPLIHTRQFILVTPPPHSAQSQETARLVVALWCIRSNGEQGETNETSTSTCSNTSNLIVFIKKLVCVVWEIRPYWPCMRRPIDRVWERGCNTSGAVNSPCVTSSTGVIVLPQVDKVKLQVVYWLVAAIGRWLFLWLLVIIARKHVVPTITLLVWHEILALCTTSTVILLAKHVSAFIMAHRCAWPTLHAAPRVTVPRGASLKRHHFVLQCYRQYPRGIEFKCHCWPQTWE